MRFDDVLSTLGDFGLYQKRLFLLLCIPAIFSGLEKMLHVVFMLAVPKHRCAIPGLENDTYEIQNEAHARLVSMFIPKSLKHGEIQYSECEIYFNVSYYDVGTTLNKSMQCSSWVYDKTVYGSTLVQEMDMVCEKKLQVTFAKMCVMIGQLIGAFIGPFADRFGRKKCILISLLSTIILSFCTAWVPNFTILCVILMVLHAFKNSLYLLCFVFGMELVGLAKRQQAGVVFNLFWSAGNLLLAVIAFLQRDWHIRQIIISVPSMLLFSYICLLPESPRWLLTKNKKEEAKRIILNAFVVNKVVITGDVLDQVEHDREPEEKFWKLFRSKLLLGRCVIIYFNWFAVAVGFYGLSINITSLFGNVYLNFFIFAVFEAHAYVFCLLFIKRIGMRKLYFGTMMLTGVACCLASFPGLFADKSYQWTVTMLATIGNTSASASFCVLYVYSSELFPTSSRSSGMSSSSFFGRIGGIVAPYIADLGLVTGGRFGRVLPVVIFGVLSCVAGLLSLLLPETQHERLPETVRNAELLGKNELNVAERELEVLEANNDSREGESVLA